MSVSRSRLDLGRLSGRVVLLVPCPLASAVGRWAADWEVPGWSWEEELRELDPAVPDGAVWDEYRKACGPHLDGRADGIPPGMAVLGEMFAYARRTRAAAADPHPACWWHPAAALHPALRPGVVDAALAAAELYGRRVFLVTADEHQVLRLQRLVRDGRVKPGYVTLAGVTWLPAMRELATRPVAIDAAGDLDDVPSWMRFGERLAELR